MKKPIIILLIIIFLIIIFLSLKKKKKSITFLPFRLNDGKSNNDNIKTVYTELTTTINNLLKFMGDIDILSGSIAGSLNKLNLKDIVSGSGEQNITSVLPPIKYTFKNLILYDFANNLKFSGTQLKVDDITNNSQTLTLYLVAKAKILQCRLTTEASMDFLGSTVRGDCTGTPINFNNVVCNMEIQFKLTNCDKLLSNISDLILSKMDITFEKVDIICDLVLDLFNIVKFPLTRLNISDYLKKTIRDNIPRVKDALAPLFNSQFRNINIPSIPCFNLGNGCLPGIDVKAKGTYTPSSLRNITWNECKNLCEQIPKCNYAAFNYGVSDDNVRGTCIFVDKKSTDVASGGDYYDKKKNIIVKKRAPFPVATSSIPNSTNSFGNEECGNICKANEGCSGFSFENGLCTMYRGADLQNFSLDLNKCQRNIIQPNLFQ
jgi:hypothetical protein